MTHKQALKIVLRAAESGASGSDKAREVAAAIRRVQQFWDTAARKPAGLVLSRAQANHLLAVLFTCSKLLAHAAPESAQAVRHTYAELAEQYAAAGFDVAELGGKQS